MSAFVVNAGPQSATLSKNKLQYKHFSVSKESLKEKSSNLEMQCILY